MAQGDFVIPPSEDLSVSGASGYGSAISALDNAGKGVQDILGQLSNASKQLYALRTDQMQAASQGDLLHIINDLNDTAAQLGNDPNGMSAIYTETGNVDANGNAEKELTGYNLGPAWTKKMDDYQKLLTEKYAAFPEIQKSVLQSFDSAAIAANGRAIQAAADNSLKNGKIEVDNNIDLLTKDAIKNGGDTTALDAYLKDPTANRFYAPSSMQAKGITAHQTVADTVLLNTLTKKAIDEGVDAAILAIPADTDPQKRSAIESQIKEVGAATQGAVNNQAVKNYQESVEKDGLLDTDAKAKATANVADPYKDAANKAVDSFATQWWKQKDTAGISSVDQYALGNGTDVPKAGWAATEVWFQKPETRKQLGMSPEGWQQELTYIQARADEEKVAATSSAGQAATAATIPHGGHVVAADPTLSAEDKTAIFQDMYSKDGWTVPDNRYADSGVPKGTVVKINGVQNDYLNSHRVNNDTSYADYKGLIAAWGQSDQVSGALPLVSAVEAKRAQILFDQEYRAYSAKGPVTRDQIQKIYDNIYSYFTDAALKVAVHDSFTKSAVFGIFQYDNTAEINSMQARIQNGEMATIAGLPAAQRDFDQLRKGQGNLLKPIADKLKLTISSDVAQNEKGQQFFFDDKGRTLAYVMAKDQKGNTIYKWMTAPTGKEPASFAQWQDLK
jgi:hypothetical protein